MHFIGIKQTLATITKDTYMASYIPLLYHICFCTHFLSFESAGPFKPRVPYLLHKITLNKVMLTSLHADLTVNDKSNTALIYTTTQTLYLSLAKHATRTGTIPDLSVWS